jgi:hypothetical protein
LRRRIDARKEARAGKARNRARKENQIRRRSNRADRLIGGPVSERTRGRREANGRLCDLMSGAKNAMYRLGSMVVAVVDATIAGKREISGQSHSPRRGPRCDRQVEQSPLKLSWQQQEQRPRADLPSLPFGCGSISAAANSGHFPTPQQQANGAPVHSAAGIMAQTTAARSRPANRVVGVLNTDLRCVLGNGLRFRQGCSNLSNLPTV